MTTTIEQRIETLERQNRRLKLLGGSTIGLVLLLVVVVSAIGQQRWKKVDPAAWKGRVIEAEAFTLRDKNGLRRAELIANGEIPGLVLYDENEMPRLMLSANKNRSFLQLADENKKTRMELLANQGISALYLYLEGVKYDAAFAATKDGSGLVLNDEGGNPRLMLLANKNRSFLQLADENRTDRLMLSAHKDTSGLVLNDEGGNPRLMLAAGELGSLLRLNDDRGEGRATLGVSSQETNRIGAMTNRPESSLVLYNKEGKVIWQAPKD